MAPDPRGAIEAVERQDGIEADVAREAAHRLRHAGGVLHQEVEDAVMPAPNADFVTVAAGNNHSLGLD